MLILVDYKNKVITPCDLKTTGHPEWEFYESFIKWSYSIQARLYWRLIRNALDSDEYFKDFKLLDYKFIVVNRKTLTPLVWDCPFTQARGLLSFGDNEMRDPMTIGKELNYYLKYNPRVPIGININGTNDLRWWLNKL